MNQTRDEILGKWEHQGYYAHCNQRGHFDSFDLVEDRLGWRDMGICSFFREDEDGKTYSTWRLKKSTLLFPAWRFREEEIRTCLGEHRIGTRLAKFVENCKLEIYNATRAHYRWVGEECPDLPTWGDLREKFEDEQGKEDAELVNWEAIEVKLKKYVEQEAIAEWHKLLLRGGIDDEFN